MGLSARTRSVLQSGLANRSAGNEIVDTMDFAVANTTGNVFYVDSGSGTDATSNGSQQQPFATIDYAIGRCTASNGDVIFVLPGHAENITTATGINFDVAGITLIGLGHGADIPTVSYTAAAGSITVAAASTVISNIKLVANYTGGVTAGITIAAAGDNCKLDGVIMRDTAAAKEMLLHLTIATGVDDLVIVNCDFRHALTGSATNSVLFAGTTANLRMENNFIFADSTDSVVDHLAGIATACLLKDNILFNEDNATAGYVIDFHASSTGLAVGNRGAYNKVDAAMTKGDAMWWIENYFSNTIAQSGLIEPPTSHAIP